MAGEAGVSKEDIERIVDAAAADGSMDARQARDARAKKGSAPDMIENRKMLDIDAEA